MCRVKGAMRHLLTNSDLALFAVLVALALWVIVYPVHGFDPSAPAALAGALFGGAALLLGNWINRYNVPNAAKAELEHRREKLKTLLAAELALADFMGFTGIAHPEEFRIVTRAHVVAWRDDLACRELSATTVRHRPSGLTSLFEYLGDEKP